MKYKNIFSVLLVYFFAVIFIVIAMLFNVSVSHASANNMEETSPISVTKVKYLGKDRLFGVAFDDPNSYVHLGQDNLQNYTYYLLYDLMPFTQRTKFTSLVPPRIDVSPPFEQWFEITSTNHHVSWVYQDLEYDYRNTVQLHGLTHQWNTTCFHEFHQTPCQNSSYYYYTQSEASSAVRKAANIYYDAIGRNATVWKFPGYAEGLFGLNALLDTFPVITHFKKNHFDEGSYEPVMIGKRIVINDSMPVWHQVPYFFGDSYFIAGHGTLVWNAEFEQMQECLNLLWCDQYRSRLRNLLSFAENEVDILYVDYSEAGEITDMYENAILSEVNNHSFQVIDNTTFPYRKRLAVRIWGGFTPDLEYVQITTPSRKKVAQNMVSYRTDYDQRYAIVVIPVENGTYAIRFMQREPQDPEFIARNVLIRSGGKPNLPAKMNYSIEWVGDADVWGEYENGNKFVHGFRFTDKRWVEKDFITGKLHILGASGSGTEHFSAYLPFSFYKTDSTRFYKKYMINTSFMRLDMPEAPISIPEKYNATWELIMTYPDGTKENKEFSDAGPSILFSATIKEKGITTIEYMRSAHRSI